MMQIISPQHACQVVRLVAPEWVWLLNSIEAENGYINFPPIFSQLIDKLNISNYPLLYDSENLIGHTLLNGLLSIKEVTELENFIANSTSGERGQRFVQLLEDIEDEISSIKMPISAEQIEAARKIFDQLSKEDQLANVKSIQRISMALMASFHQCLSVMVTGKKLTDLVSLAKSGDDKAFALAIQIDKKILLEHPHFKKRFAQAQLVGDRDFLESIGAHLARPPYKGRVRHKALYLAFAFLEQAGVLDNMSHTELLDLCNEAGLDTVGGRIDDVKNLTKRLASYRSFQRNESHLSTP